MVFIDTHTHLYLDAFAHDRESVIKRAYASGVHHVLLPNIDSHSVDDLHMLASAYPAMCHPMMGLHPTSVKEDWEEELQVILDLLDTNVYSGLGEIGIDLYWDTTYQGEQLEVFQIQLKKAATLGLPVSIHSRNAMDLILNTLEGLALPGLKGVLHCFSGDMQQARRALDMGFYLGFGGVVTFKKSGLNDIIPQISIDHILLETDAPFLAPVPYRGKRNESSYLLNIAVAIATLKGISLEEVAEVTTASACNMFNIPKISP